MTRYQVAFAAELPEVRHEITDIVSNGRVNAQEVFESIDAIYQVESMPVVTIVRNGQSRDVTGTMAAQLMELANKSTMTYRLAGTVVTFC